ncbi:MAG: SDR family NAD(P)-dependent oxidoreductase, partial [Deltaproteobacteria bacterium]|nr:SDR family NAD(P)-dependent oxidoreductase [Deltaproteobacteria bacterium]
MDCWSGKNVLITGVCGTIGQALVERLVQTEVAEIVGLDNAEGPMFFAQQAYRHDPRVRLFLGDVRDRDTLIHRMHGIDVVLHTAAYKHVHLCEESPNDAVMTNIHGVQNVVEAANARGVERVLFTSSDKAVNPTNVMGTSKLMGERLMTGASAACRDGGPVFASCRFGNVVGSHGSVVPLFRQQIEAGGPVTVTDPTMTRFIMSRQQAAQLVLDSTLLAKGGEAFVTKMPVICIADLAAVMVDELAPQAGYDPKAIPIEIIGPRPGEKMYEELMNSEELRRLVELERYYVVLPAFRALHREIDYRYDGMREVQGDRPYTSLRESPMTRDEI